MFRKILIADDHSIVRLGVAVAFEENYRDVEIDFAENYFEAEKIISEKAIDLLIMDIQMRGVQRSVIKHMKLLNPGMKILLFSGFTGETVRQLISEGADGFLSKQSSYDQIMDAVRTLYHTGSAFPEGRTGNPRSLFERIGPHQILSAREYEVFMYLVEGKGNLEITNLLSLKPGTVTTYKKRIFAKLKVENVAELVKIHLEFRNLEEQSSRL